MSERESESENGVIPPEYRVTVIDRCLTERVMNRLIRTAQKVHCNVVSQSLVFISRDIMKVSTTSRQGNPTEQRDRDVALCRRNSAQSYVKSLDVSKCSTLKQVESWKFREFLKTRFIIM